MAATRKAATAGQRETIARLLASGSSAAAAGRAAGLSDRTVRRLRDDPDFQALIAKAVADAETAAWNRDRAAARRAGLPTPSTPAARREMQKALSPEALARANAERSLAARRNAPDEEVLAWVLEQQPANEMDYLDLHDAECGNISRRARLRFEGRLAPPRLKPFTTPSCAEQRGFFDRTGPDMRDPFAGMYGSGPDSGNRYQLRTVFVPADEQ